MYCPLPEVYLTYTSQVGTIHLHEVGCYYSDIFLFQTLVVEIRLTLELYDINIINTSQKSYYFHITKISIKTIIYQTLTIFQTYITYV
jgi:hypothetical protein